MLPEVRNLRVDCFVVLLVLLVLVPVSVPVPLFTLDCLSFFLDAWLPEVPEEPVLLFLDERVEVLVEDPEELLPDDWEVERLVFWLFSEEFTKASGDLLSDKSLLLSAEMPLSVRAPTVIPVRVMIPKATIAVFSMLLIFPCT